MQITARLITLCLCLTISAIAETRFPKWFGNNQVLQRQMSVPIWGWDEPGTTVTVTFGGQTKTAVTGDDGKWMVKLDAMEANAEGAQLKAIGSSEITLENVVVGEVWLCSGQSNMAWSVARSIRKDDGENGPIQQALAAADLPQIRHIKIAIARSTDGPNDDAMGTWQVATPETALAFSATAFFMGRKLHAELDVPIGLINSSVGGTPVEAWTSREALDAEPAAAWYLERWAKMIAAWNPADAKAHNDKLLAKWEDDKAAAEEAGEKAPRRPRLLSDPSLSSHYPSTLYNGMIAPLIPYAIRGAVWYQGESNAARFTEYRTLFPLMISQWRQVWGQGDFPFGYVQLAQFQASKPEPDAHGGWANQREAQDYALALPNTGCASAIDVGEARDIHPRYKIDVGERLALWSLATVYGRDIVYSGPRYAGMEVKGSEIVVSFTHIGGGLIVAKKDGWAAPVPTPDAPLKQFMIAGADQQWVWADARIEGDTVVLSSPQVSDPVAVRYAWASNPAGANLYNAALLPANPFRTDDWGPPTQTK